jgi:hypothetical protein
MSLGTVPRYRRPRVRVGKFLDRAEVAVDDARSTIGLGVAVSVAALIVAAVALIIAIRR